MQLVNILVQLVALVLLFIGWQLKKRGKFVWHGDTMLVAVLLVVLLVISHMGPSLIGLAQDVSASFLNATQIVGLIHTVVGTVAIVLSAWLVANWAYVQSSSDRYCAARRKKMRTIAILWLAALAIGMTYYFFHSISPG